MPIDYYNKKALKTSSFQGFFALSPGLEPTVSTTPMVKFTIF